MLQAYRDAFGSFNSLSDLLSVISDPQKISLFPIYTFPAYVAANLNGIGIIATENSAVENRAASIVQDVLAIMLFYSQPSLFARVLAPKLATFENGSELQVFASDLINTYPPTTWVSLAIQRYQIFVGKGTMISYVVIMGITLIPCFIVLVVSSMPTLHIPELSGFPFLDVIAECREQCILDLASKYRSSGPRMSMRRLLRILSEKMLYTNRT
jgi:hypothetical protein